MLNANDVQQLRASKMTNYDILKQMARVVPSAAKAISDIDNDKATPANEREAMIGRMIDANVPKTGASGLPYVHKVSLNAAQKQFDDLEESNAAFERGDQSQDTFLGGLKQGFVSNVKGAARAVLGVPMLAATHIFKTADDLAAYLSGTEPTKLTDKQKQFVDKDLPLSVYNDAENAAGLYTTIATANPALGAKVSAGVASGKRLLAKAGYAPEGAPTGDQVSWAEIPISGAQAYIGNRLLFSTPQKALIGGALFSAANEVLDNVVHGNGEKKSLAGLLGRSAGAGLAMGAMHVGGQKAMGAKRIQEFLNRGAEPAPMTPASPDGPLPPSGGVPPPDGAAPVVDGAAPAMDGGAPVLGPDGQPIAPKSVVPGAAIKETRSPGMIQGAIEQASGLRPESQAVAADPALRGMTQDFLSGKQSPQTVLDKFGTSFKDLVDRVSDTGREYQFVRESKAAMPSPAADFRTMLNEFGYDFVPEGKVRMSPIDKVAIQNGRVEAGATPQEISSAQFSALTKAMQLLSVKDITLPAFRSAKRILQTLGDFHDPSLPGGGGEIRALAGKMLSRMEDMRTARGAPPDFRKYADLDKRYAPMRAEMDSVKKAFFEPDPVTGDLRIKDTAQGKILNALRGNKFNLLERLERTSPGLTRQLRAYEAYKDIVTANIPGQYAKAALKTAGALATVGGIAGGAPLGAIGGVLGLLASNPAIMFSVLAKYADISKSTGWDPVGIMQKVEHGAPLTAVEKQAVQGAFQEILADPTPDGAEVIETAPKAPAKRSKKK
jgi:hypothetical protein